MSSLASDTQLGYWDYQVSGEFELGPKDHLGLRVLGANDELHAGDYDSELTFHRVDPRYQHAFSKDTRLVAAATLGLDETASENGAVSDRLLAPRLQFLHRVDEEWSLRVGLDASFDDYQLELGNELRYRTIRTLEGVGATRWERSYGSWLELDWHPVPHVWVWPGLRADLFTSGDVTERALDPRIAARFEISERVAFEHSLGLAHQSASFVPGIPGAAVTNIHDGLQRSVQASASVEFRLPSRSILSLTAFDAIYTNLADPLGTEHHFSLDDDQLLERVSGHAYGLEVFFKRPLSRDFGAMISYTLSRSQRSHERIATLSALDRPHVVGATLVHTPGRNWLLSARNTLHSGLPTRRNTNSGPIFDGKERTDVFYRLDLRAEKRYRVGASSSLALVAELLNATFSHETTERSCSEVGCREVGVGPIVIPNLGRAALLTRSQKRGHGTARVRRAEIVTSSSCDPAFSRPDSNESCPNATP